ncbi:ABC transporter substrate-binding protein [Pseudomonas fluorescens]|jgi:histidine transport system substrate-binding protein|uniref:Transporter substrate-binding domain-containing protein n=1 Tax=Pseudomonas shahriarae TaxID=2745512 RepID=A0ABT5NB85_9PSED|nr:MULTISPECIES: transporter substrate-binding domain-containing protein [Pseudomonas]AYG09981.1 ABC transporter substrate-binding protein [Pseudomonas fluorescens]MDZ4302315.1 transporter substrate-binding domain-containing protein [Pseudomonas sp.]OAE17777.1 ABC transporter substrate-binding protein [Pseudomonas brenneri]MBJ2240863.1 transporter substrate-binding domain-containing protein [Pseudomonas sp. MF6768]MBJ2250831.1 transporter substrate-binding domain-containing protein [Pseudomona
MKKIVLMLSLSIIFLFNGSVLAKNYEVIRFGVDPNYAPFAYKDNTGQLVGFEVDIGNAICAHLDVRCQWVEIDYDAMIPSLKAGKIDAILASMSITAARLKVIDFTSEVFSSPTAMVYRQGTRLEAPSGQSVGYLQGSIQEVYAKQVLAKAGMKVVAYPDQEQVYADLITGRLQASLQDAQQARSGFLRSPRGAGFVLGPVIESELMPAKSAIGLAKGNAALKGMLDQGLAALHTDGTYARLQDQYFDGMDMFSGN